MVRAMSDQPENRIEALRRARKMSMAQLGAAIGATASTVSKIEKGQMALTAAYAQRIAKAFELPVAALLADQADEAEEPSPAPEPRAHKALPIFGLAAGSAAGAFTMTNDPVEWVSAPPGLSAVRDAYALRVTGRSMQPAFYPDDIIFVHPHRPPRTGDDVVIQEKQGGGVAAYLKHFERETGDEIVTSQYNPATELRFRKAHVLAFHRVMRMHEVFGI
jgi:phage repressor protein C with HTH and peptisase S24 domain